MMDERALDVRIGTEVDLGATMIHTGISRASNMLTEDVVRRGVSVTTSNALGAGAVHDDVRSAVLIGVHTYCFDDQEA
jgi:hypothetical protein